MVDRDAPRDDTQHADDVAEDDPHKTEKLAKAGEDIDPNDGQE